MRKSPLKKKSKASAATLRVKLWKLTRERVFEHWGRDCYTCNAKSLQGANLQCGHVPWPASILSTAAKFDIRFMRPQCYKCNIWGSGMQYEAAERMKREGVDLDELRRYNQSTKGLKYGISWFKDRLNHFPEFESL